MLAAIVAAPVVLCCVLWGLFLRRVLRATARQWDLAPGLAGGRRLLVQVATGLMMILGVLAAKHGAVDGAAVVFWAFLEVSTPDTSAADQAKLIAEALSELINGQAFALLSLASSTLAVEALVRWLTRGVSETEPDDAPELAATD